MISFKTYRLHIQVLTMYAVGGVCTVCQSAQQEGSLALKATKEVRTLIEIDANSKAGSFLVIELHPGYGGAALTQINYIHKYNTKSAVQAPELKNAPDTKPFRPCTGFIATITNDRIPIYSIRA